MTPPAPPAPPPPLNGVGTGGGTGITANDGLGKIAVATTAAITIAEICFFIAPSTKLNVSFRGRTLSAG